MKQFHFLPYEGSIWFNLKVILGLPFPLKNHFYKWHRMSFKIGWYCNDCYQFFQVKPTKAKIKEIYCPHCNSRNWYYSTKLARAWIDKKSKAEIQNIISSLNR